MAVQLRRDKALIDAEVFRRVMCSELFQILFSYLIGKQSFKGVWREVKRLARVD